MNEPDEIIEMARQAGLHVATDVNWMPIIGFEYAEKLIALARSDEREACAKVCDVVHMLEVLANPAEKCAKAIRVRGEA